MNASVSEHYLPLKTAFAALTVELPLELIQPLKLIPPALRSTSKWQEIQASIQEEGLVEWPVVTPIADRPGYYYLVDGHVRLEAFRELGGTVVECLVTTVDDTYTFNSLVNRISAVQDHRMLLRAIHLGVPMERLSRGLARTPETIRRKVRMLDGICPEVVALLGDTRCPAAVFEVLKKLKPIRQIEAAELMASGQNFGVPFARALVTATPDELLVEPSVKNKHRKEAVGAIARVERELATLQLKTSTVEDSYGRSVVDLTLLRAHLATLLDSIAVVRWLARNRPEYLREFQKVVDVEDVGRG